ncbi:glycerol-3-phosphate 1-O-acyltransferase PlsY [Streptobacillus moniliformis]|uniref:Glycerol-3-phosphate acyltransferase n=1 Tax=Streptobacillus moniliformis (strain ATCC 14647 / DSM 12112 / NCTC 10651 / 9901) TaxID=519441 RepID=D1AXM7_STRM9|nr:glycerol-3-phosphate 1-O-acyltransferase PlsY [Streptobacillus moniliformis]ACZ01053.1 acyl-phosphate glycerol-3-phosphate acyltransferase [Streptobacillus moniliformis DSM 12112]AVL42577.1 acyl-phosphate glycerol 3-phosphate acyltransferase [Streptobacillus moniliformis]SQA13805.1 G3P acyltransferase [Streptobacillus moniliformis]
MFEVIILTVLAYLLGSIPNALWIGKIFKNIDVREYGSGNVGSTNAARVLGWKLGLFTLLLDVLKGSIFVIVAKKLNLDDIYLVLIGMAAILGHSYSIYLGFKGGKAVATSLGVFIILVPKVILLLLIVFIVIVFITQYVSLSSITCAFLLPILVYMLYNNVVYTIFGLFIAMIIIIRHKSNIINLINKKEAKFFDKANKK